MLYIGDGLCECFHVARQHVDIKEYFHSSAPFITMEPAGSPKKQHRLYLQEGPAKMFDEVSQVCCENVTAEVPHRKQTRTRIPNRRLFVVHFVCLCIADCLFMFWLLLSSQQQGFQSHNRYLFLFDDLLIVAKPSGRNRYVRLIQVYDHLVGGQDYLFIYFYFWKAL